MILFCTSPPLPSPHFSFQTYSHPLTSILNHQPLPGSMQSGKHLIKNSYTDDRCLSTPYHYTNISTPTFSSVAGETKSITIPEPSTAYPNNAPTVKPNAPTSIPNGHPPPTLSPASASTPSASASAPFVSAPSINAPSVSTPSVSTPSVSAPAISTPSIFTPSVSSPVGAQQLPGSSSYPSKDCLSGSETVTMESGGSKVLSEVFLGNRILTSDVAGLLRG
jgi:hypothetical protein